MEKCLVCNQEYKYINKHYESQKHKINSNKKKLKTNTDRSRNYTYNIIKSLNVNSKTKPQELYNLLKQNYKLNTIKTIIQQGFLLNYNVSPQLHAEYKLFLRNLNDEIIKENIDKYQNISDKKINDIKTTDRYINLYLIMPLRIETFINILIFSHTPNTNIKSSHINLHTKKIHFINTKTSDDEFELKDNIIKFIKDYFCDKIDNMQPIYDKSSKTFANNLKSLGFTSQMIRRMYSNEASDNIYSSRLLNHSYNTEKAIYKN